MPNDFALSEMESWWPKNATHSYTFINHSSLRLIIHPGPRTPIDFIRRNYCPSRHPIQETGHLARPMGASMICRSSSEANVQIVPYIYIYTYTVYIYIYTYLKKIYIYDYVYIYIYTYLMIGGYLQSETRSLQYIQTLTRTRLPTAASNNPTALTCHWQMRAIPCRTRGNIFTWLAQMVLYNIYI